MESIPCLIQTRLKKLNRSSGLVSHNAAGKRLRLMIKEMTVFEDFDRRRDGRTEDRRDPQKSEKTGDCYDWR